VLAASPIGELERGYLPQITLAIQGNEIKTVYLPMFAILLARVHLFLLQG